MWRGLRDCLRCYCFVKNFLTYVIFSLTIAERILYIVRHKGFLMKQHESAKAWRLRRNLSLEELSELTGYSVVAIRKFEAGARHVRNNEQHSEWVWQRYRMACSGAERQLKSGREFVW